MTIENRKPTKTLYESITDKEENKGYKSLAIGLGGMALAAACYATGWDPSVHAR